MPDRRTVAHREADESVPLWHHVGGSVCVLLSVLSTAGTVVLLPGKVQKFRLRQAGERM